MSRRRTRHKHASTRSWIVMLVFVVLAAWVACSRQRASHSTLPSAREPPLVPYARERWPHWRDEDHDCQNTRHEVLIAESLVPVTFADPQHCKVARGRWRCPYTGRTFEDPEELDVDHLVPLAEAHAAGGHRWLRARRTAYANDLSHPDHLVAVARAANRQKGAQGPDAWLPERRENWCWYGRAWRRVKSRWGLSSTPAERASLEKLELSCPASPRP